LPGRSCDLIGGLIFAGHFRGSSFENTGTGFLHGCPKHADLLLARKQQIGMSWAARTCWHPLLSALSTLPCSLSREHPARKGRVSDTRRTISPTRWCHHQDEASPWRLSPLGAHERECTENGKSTTGMCKKKRDHLWLPIEDALASRKINDRHVQKKERPPLATHRRCARKQPLSPETGPLQSRKRQPSQSEEKRRTTCGQRAPYRALCGEHEGKTAPACPAPSVHERRSTRALFFGSRQLRCRPIRTLDSASSPRRKGQHTRSTAGGH